MVVMAVSPVWVVGSGERLQWPGGVVNGAGHCCICFVMMHKGRIMDNSLHDASFDDDPTRVQSTLVAPGDIERRNQDGHTPLLHCCTCRPDIKLVELLIGHCAYRRAGLAD